MVIIVIPPSCSLPCVSSTPPDSGCWGELSRVLKAGGEGGFLVVLSAVLKTRVRSTSPRV